MKTLKFILSAFILAVSLQSCYKTVPATRGKGSIQSDIRVACGFTKIQLCMDADVYYTQDSVCKVEVVAQPNIAELIKTEVNGETLVIDTKKRICHYEQIKVIIHTPHINGMYISGSGDIFVQNSLVTDYLELKISGSGDIRIPGLTAQKFDTKISGSGDIAVNSGNVDEEFLYINGSGDIRIMSLNAKINVSKISGSGDIDLNVSDNLDITISGSGDIRYRGNPIVTSRISGSGDLRHLN